MIHKQDPPFCIQIELVEGCNLFCKFCGIHGIRKNIGNYKFMEFETAEKIARQIACVEWTPRIEFAMHGEPMVHSDCERIIAMFRQVLPKAQLMLTSNGILLAKQPNRIERLLSSGLNILAIDDYGHKAIEKLKESFPAPTYPINTKSPHRKWPKDTKTIIYIQDIRTATKGGHSNIWNHCGCAAPPLRKPLNKRCTRPFREVSIRWDGNVALCCNDFRGVYRCGNINAEPIYAIWQNKYFLSARKFLYAGRRNFYPCNICNNISYRIGLLPDKMGKQELPPPDDNDYIIVNKAISNGPFTSAILRPWEMEG
jgi:MoaA/NifB/PqqE/SkfB family radical SAM enzyme